MENQDIQIRFENVLPADANRYASELKDFLLREGSDVEAEIKKERSDTQDFGTILILVLGTEAIIEVSKGIADWLRKRNSATVSITTKDGASIKGTGLTSSQIHDLLREHLSAN